MPRFCTTRSSHNVETARTQACNEHVLYLLVHTRFCTLIARCARHRETVGAEEKLKEGTGGAGVVQQIRSREFTGINRQSSGETFTNAQLSACSTSQRYYSRNFARRALKTSLQCRWVTSPLIVSDAAYYRRYATHLGECTAIAEVPSLFWHCGHLTSVVEPNNQRLTHIL